MIMQDWQKRVIEERSQLSDKLDKLGNYIDSDKFNDIDARNRRLLEAQWKAMSDYLVILDKRISIIQDECLAKMIDNARDDVQNGNVMSTDQAIDALKRARDGR